MIVKWSLVMRQKAKLACQYYKIVRRTTNTMITIVYLQIIQNSATISGAEPALWTSCGYSATLVGDPSDWCCKICHPHDSFNKPRPIKSPWLGQSSLYSAEWTASGTGEVWLIMMLVFDLRISPS